MYGKALSRIFLFSKILSQRIFKSFIKAFRKSRINTRIILRTARSSAKHCEIVTSHRDSSGEGNEELAARTDMYLNRPMTDLREINVALAVVAEFNHREKRYIQHLTSRHYRSGLG